MSWRRMRRTLVITLFFLLSAVVCRGQFGGGSNLLNNTVGGNGMFGDSGSSQQSRTGEDGKTVLPDTNRFTFKKYFRSLSHKDSVNVGWTWAMSLVLPGTAQIYNGDYKKLPVFYGGMAAGLGSGIYFNCRYNKWGETSDHVVAIAGFATAGAFYLASVLDGVICYPTGRAIHPGKATIYSAMLPGAGQAYIGQWWTVPIIYAGLATGGFLWYFFDSKYQMYHDKYYRKLDFPQMEPDYTLATLKMYKDRYRRFRNYAIIGTALWYVLQIVHADVFATLDNFDINEDITFNISPTVITPIQPYNELNYSRIDGAAYGLSLNFTF